MALIVQKFGGSSVADAGKIHAAASRAIAAKLLGNQVCVVVSAMGDSTDTLIELAHEVCPNPPKREMDQLLATGEQVTIALMAILGGMVSVVGSIVVGSLLANGGTGNSNAPIVVGLCFLGACLTVMIHYVGWPRALLGLTVGFLILLLIGCVGLGIFCGFIKF